MTVEQPTGDRIAITGITANGYHGVLPHERREGQRFRADVVLEVDLTPAAASDTLDQTVDYSVVARGIHAILAGDPVDLIETVAGRCLDVALASPLVTAATVTIHKPQAPVGVPVDDVTVTLRRANPQS